MLNIRPASSPTRRRRQRGASLIEVLIAAALLAGGMFALAWLQAAAIQYDKMSQFRAIAIQLAGGLADRMRSNVDEVASYAWTSPYSPETDSIALTDCRALACSAAEMAAFDLVSFRNDARSLLPGGDLHVTVDGPNALTVWVLWRAPDALDNATGGASFAGGCPATALASSPDPVPQCLPIRVVL